MLSHPLPTLAAPRSLYEDRKPFPQSQKLPLGFSAGDSSSWCWGACHVQLLPTGPAALGPGCRKPTLPALSSPFHSTR